MESKYIIIDSSEIDDLDISQTLDTSKETIRKSVDGTKALIEWDGKNLSFLDSINIEAGPFLLEEVPQTLSSDFWVDRRSLH